MSKGSQAPDAYTLEEVSDLLPAGVRLTAQRSEVYGVVASCCDHPTAAEVFERAQKGMPCISLATVYNCLETLTGCGAIRQVNLERSSTRYCANRSDHVHFHCEKCGEVVDAVPTRTIDATRLWQLPVGSAVTSLDIAVRGLCPGCLKKHAAKN